MCIGSVVDRFGRWVISATGVLLGGVSTAGHASSELGPDCASDTVAGELRPNCVRDTAAGEL